jgi:DNA-binding HxlR family transcriptional regulator
VLGALQDGTQRYSEIRRRVGGISEKMLAKTLDELARDGLVERTSYPVVPPRVEYALTPLGHDLAQRIGSLITWINENVAELVAMQKAHDADAAARVQQPS